jgi:hypothetical protein
MVWPSRSPAGTQRGASKSTWAARSLSAQLPLLCVVDRATFPIGSRANSMPATDEENAFMAGLLSDISDDFFAAAPSPSTTLVKPRPSPPSLKRARSPENPRHPPSPLLRTPKKPPRSPKKQRRTPRALPLLDQQVNVDDLLAGADDWEWDDMLTPKKDKTKRRPTSPSSPRRTRVAPVALPNNATPYASDSCTRCIIEAIETVDDFDRVQKVGNLTSTLKCS